MNRAAALAAVVQARMSSTRRPGKVLHRVAGRPVLAFLLERLARGAGVPRVIVATSDDPTDDPIAQWCEGYGVECFRGPLENVAARYAAVARSAGLDAFVRVTGDSPLLDPALVRRAVRIFRRGGAQLVTNTFPRSFPRGQSVEVVEVAAFNAALERMDQPDDREHVTRWFYRHADQVRLENFTARQPRPDLQLSVDTPDDLALFEATVARMTRPQWTYGLDAVVALREQVVAAGIPA